MTFCAVGAGAGGAAGGGGAAAAPAQQHLPTSFLVVAHDVPEAEAAGAAAEGAPPAAGGAGAQGGAQALRCSRCGADVPPANAERHETHCARHLVPCAQCGALLQRSAAASHLHCSATIASGSAAAAAAHAPCRFVCSSPQDLARHVGVFHTPFACSACGAGPGFFPGEAYEAHLRDACGAREVFCDFPSCDLRMRASALGEHQQSCGNMTIAHEKCGYRVLRRNWREHIASSCAVGQHSRLSRPSSAEGGAAARGGGSASGRPPRS